MDQTLEGLGLRAQCLRAQPVPPPSDEGPSVPRAWASLPPELLAAILHPKNAGKEARLVCATWRDAYDGNIRRATLRLLPLVAVGPDLPLAPPQAQLLRLDAADMLLHTTHSLGLEQLADMLQRWPLAAPLELDLSNSLIEEAGVQALAGTLRCLAFAPGGLQALDLSDNECMLDGPAVAAQFAAALPAAPQVSALRELRLACCGLYGEGSVALCTALQAATHMRNLTLLDLSDNDLGVSDSGPAALGVLASCLRGSQHLSSLQQLLLKGCRGGDRAACALASAVAEARLPLVALDLRDNKIGRQGAAAWAAVLCAATCMAGLEVLDLGRNTFFVDDLPNFQDMDALRAATHLTRLRRLSPVLPCSRDPEYMECVARLLQGAPHLAASLQDLDLSRCNVPGAMMAVLGDAVLAGGVHLPRLTRLDLSGCGISCSSKAVHQLCAALIAGTQLTGLRELDLRRNGFYKEGYRQLFEAFMAATHLSGLRALRVANSPVSGAPMAGLLQAAAHLHGLTTLHLTGICAPDGLTELRVSLQPLLALRSLEIAGHNSNVASALELAAALNHAPCTPSLEELTFLHRHDYVSNEAVLHSAAALQACTRLSGLRRLTLWLPGRVDPEVMAQAGQVLGACGHLSGLHELRLELMGLSGFEKMVGVQSAMCDGLACGRQAATVRVITRRV